MMRPLAWAAGVLLLASCRRAPPPPEASRATAEPLPAQSAVRRGPRLAYASGKSLCVQRLAPDALPPKACTALPDTIEQLAWVDRDEVAALLASGGVMLASEHGARAPRSASHYLVTVTHDFIEVTRSSTYWMTACDAKPARELTGIVIGSDGFWGHDDEKGWMLRHGDRELGVIDGALPVFGG